MGSVEDQVRVATRAEAGTLREVRPLRLPPAPGQEGVAWPGARVRRARRPRTWMAPVSAAAAVMALAISLVIVRDVPNGRVVPHAPHAQSVALTPVPRYYVALSNPENANSPDPVVVADTSTGKRVATVNPPAHHTFGGVTAAADDRTFVLDVRQFPWSNTYAQVTPRSWYLLRIAPGTTHPARLARLPIPPTPNGARVDGIALSPDGTQLAVMYQPNMMGPAPGPVTLRIYSVATGKVLRTWTGPTPNPNGVGVLDFDMSLYVDNNITLAWQDGGRLLSFIYGPQIINDKQVRILDPSRPGDALLADSRVVLDLTAVSDPGCTSLLLTAGGRTIECGAYFLNPGGEGNCTGATGPRRPGFYEYSAVTGKLTRVIYQYRGACWLATAQVLWASPSGGTLIGVIAVRFKGKTRELFLTGVFSQGQFRPLSFPTAGSPLGPGGIAW